ncbi:SRPBCC family protein [Muricauda sp. CAU 1633]|uniref:SRPBCC family protein n=1 Tax=Allomuricauda sp. CAU 1633 TaxID=2816036 RepID=UPI001A8F4D6D|nr:SRPBCC family protein [Muricauda sp. CAU 1633]MBO0323419.1 SRPBCC family protein [Muricauda sp. CAU 1633]
MKLYQLCAKQFLPISKEEGWEFLSNPKNLKTITPPHMGFHIVSGGDEPMYSGQIIQYVVKPFPFMSTKWVTEITHLIQGEYFVDEQRFGPYALWHHKHFIRETSQGIEMKDIIDYKLPFGILGQLFHSLIIKKQLQKIFAYREQKLTHLFGKANNLQSSLEFRSI